jgi:hypothetical protein
MPIQIFHIFTEKDPLTKREITSLSIAIVRNELAVIRLRGLSQTK